MFTCVSTKPEDCLTLERVRFETLNPVPKHCIWNGTGYSVTEYDAWQANEYRWMFIGWLKRSQIKE